MGKRGEIINEAKEGNKEEYFIIAPITKMGTYTNYKTYFFTYLEKKLSYKKRIKYTQITIICIV